MLLITGIVFSMMAQEKQYINDFGFLLHLPEGYEDDEKSYPLLIFLHGAGERGDNLDMVAVHGPPMLARRGANPGFIIVSPQCDFDEWWTDKDNIYQLNKLYDHILKTYRVDESRIYLTGLSMGGFGSWKWANESPEKFAAVVPICGGGDSTNVVGLTILPIWAFHGAQDMVVPVEKSKEMVEAIEKAGGNVKLTIYPESKHDSWTETYANPDLYKWFLKYSR